MKKYMDKLIKFKMNLRSAIALLAICFLPFVQLQAQPNDVGDGEEGVPLDGGLSLVLAAGAAYGIKKGYDWRKNKSK